MNNSDSAVRFYTREFNNVANMLLESWNEWNLYSESNQLSLCIPKDLDTTSIPYTDQLRHGTGSFVLKKWPYKDTDYTKLIQGFEYVQPIFDYLRKLGLEPCRPMIRCLHPKTCLSYHSDDASFRFHIPLSTTWQCFFVVQDKVERMMEIGSLYSLQTELMHTAVNANLNKPRLHFTISAYRIEND